MKQHLMEAPPIKLMSKLPKDPFAGGYKARHDGMEDTAYLKSLCHIHEGEVVQVTDGGDHGVNPCRVWNLPRLIQWYGQTFDLDTIYTFYNELEQVFPKKQRSKKKR